MKKATALYIILGFALLCIIVGNYAEPELSDKAKAGIASIDKIANEGRIRIANCASTPEEIKKALVKVDISVAEAKAKIRAMDNKKRAEVKAAKAKQKAELKEKRMLAKHKEKRRQEAIDRAKDELFYRIQMSIRYPNSIRDLRGRQFFCKDSMEIEYLFSCKNTLGMKVFHTASLHSNLSGTKFWDFAIK